MEARQRRTAATALLLAFLPGAAAAALTAVPDITVTETGSPRNDSTTRVTPALRGQGAGAAAAGWTIVPDITVIETYNDNPGLSTGTRRSDFITQVTPGLRIDGAGARFRANLSVRPTALFYARNTDTDEIRNEVNGFARLEAVERFFFVEALANVRNNFISPFGARPADPTTVTANRTETRSFGLSPYVTGQLWRDHAYELRHRSTWTTADVNLLGDVYRKQWTARLASPVRRFGWALDYDDSRTRYEQEAVTQELETRLARGTVLFEPDPAYRFSLSAGREENNYARGEERSSSMRGAGLAWRPGPRTSGDFQYERRFFGPSRLARLQHRTRLTAWNLSYSRSTSDFQQELLRLVPGSTAALLDSIFAARIPDPVERQAAVQEFIRTTGVPAVLNIPTAFFTQQVFVQERAEASIGILGVRNSITFSVFASDSERLSELTSIAVPDAFIATDRIRQHGFGVRADHRVTPFTSLGAGATRTFARRETPTVADSRNDYYSASLNHTFSPDTTGFGGVSLTRFDERSLGAPVARARSVFVGVNHRF